MRVAVIQARPRGSLYNKKNLRYAIKLLDRIKNTDVDIAALPEGYPSVGEGELCKKAKDLGVYLIFSILTKSKITHKAKPKRSAGPK